MIHNFFLKHCALLFLMGLFVPAGCSNASDKAQPYLFSKQVDRPPLFALNLVSYVRSEPVISQQTFLKTIAVDTLVHAPDCDPSSSVWCHVKIYEQENQAVSLEGWILADHLSTQLFAQTDLEFLNENGQAIANVKKGEILSFLGISDDEKLSQFWKVQFQTQEGYVDRTQISTQAPKSLAKKMDRTACDVQLNKTESACCELMVQLRSDNFCDLKPAIFHTGNPAAIENICYATYCNGRIDVALSESDLERGTNNYYCGEDRKPKRGSANCSVFN